MGDGALCHDCKRYKCICNDPEALAAKQRGLAEVLTPRHGVMCASPDGPCSCDGSSKTQSGSVIVAGEGFKRDVPPHCGHTLVALEGLDGCGKCFGKGTPVLMFDGSVKNVEDIKDGDRVMGPDSQPRTVRGIARGRAALYQVTPSKGMAYIVNAAHVLSLRMSYPINWKARGEIVNITVADYLQAPGGFRQSAQGWRTGIDFPSTPVLLDPYLVGMWLGDGHTSQPIITTGDEEVVEFLTTFCAANPPLTLTKRNSKPGCAAYALTSTESGVRRINPVINALKDYGVYHTKRIPAAYLRNDATVRLAVLAGLVDSDGHLRKSNFELTLKSAGLSDDVVYLARSLGFAAYKTEVTKQATNSKNPVSRTYYRIYIGGPIHTIPTKIPRKQAQQYARKKNVLNVNINVEPAGVGDYFGFTVDQDHLFLLGDFTVVHNSTQVTNVAKAIKATTLKFPYYDNRSGREIIKAFNNPHHDTTLAAYSLQALQTVNRLEERVRLWNALNSGHLVLDRYTASGLAYGMADGLPFEWLMAITPGDIPVPDYQIYIDIDVEDSFIRRPERADAYEANRDRLEHVRRMYLGLFGNPPKTVSHRGKETAWLVVDGRGNIDDVHQRILACLR